MSTDDLLDEATRLARAEYVSVDVSDCLRALVERVRDAEAERQEWADLWQQASMSVLRLTDERDAARGKLDKVRDWAHHIRTTRQRGDIEYNAASEVLAILDDKDG